MAVPDQPPAWVGQVPVVGDELERYWTGFAEDRKRWMDQLDKEVTSPAAAPEDRGGNRGRTGGAGAARSGQGWSRMRIRRRTKKDESPHVVVLLGTVSGVGEVVVDVRRDWRWGRG